ncbi:RHS repeat domain-containing protein [Planosporangium mesophilum]|uniref:Type IV secretion protein Rhs n=1 Tax=Planosporangium mesophilum TaxID=689768 RepID=A0A8J3TCY6_9ACTN|nr:RHS repeat-associated core domain-containing protein [Planosporangium mesophilum]GII22529.1 type IV secretion protein Rhs [Planosporangium mesophilum]
MLGPVPAAAAPRKPAPPPPVSKGRAVTGVTPLPLHFAKPGNDPAKRKFTPTATTWPAAGAASITVTAPAAGVKEGAKARGAKTPAWVQAVADATGRYTGPAKVDVRVLDHAAATAAGIDGVLLTVKPSGPGAGDVRVGIDYAAFAQAYGGNYGQRLRLVALPACVLTAPKTVDCRRVTPLDSVNDRAAKSVSAKVPVGGSSATAASSSTPMVMAATTSTDPGAEGGAAGTYAATTLAPSGSWTGGGSTGSFTYTYPITTPPAASPLIPKVGLGYDSGDVDGKTASTQVQASWVGDGWTTPHSFIEQSFMSCADNPEGIASPVSTSDLCYNGPVLTMSLNGSSTSLVWDAGKQVWKADNDTGMVITHVTNSGNGTGTDNTDYWKVTARDGMVFSFGRNQLPGWASGKPTTNSVDSVPVYSAHQGDPCYSSAGFAPSVCTMAYRWNLDYVTDVHGNAMSYYYQQDTNFYGQNKGAKNTQYIRDSRLDHIDYGFTDGNAYGTVPDKVVFTTGDRCLSGTCQPLNATNKANWPDVPFDLVCASGATCTAYGPSFFSTVRLTSIVMQQYSTASSSYVTVDSYALTQTMPETGDGTSPTLWLASITHTGSATTGGGSTTPITLPPVSFTSVKLQNRVDTVTDGLPAFYRHRIATITTESGSVISATYQLIDSCAGPVTLTPASNTSSCYPVYWTPAGYTKPFLDWFNKYVVTKVTQTDPTGGAAATATSYSYLGGAAWHFDDNEVVQAKYRTYGQFRGYGRVQTRGGDGVNDKQTLSETTYYRGMSNNNNSTAVTVTDSAGGNHDDTNQLAGKPLETTAYLGDGGPIDHSIITSYWVSAATATRNRSGLPALTANWVAPIETYTRQAVTSGGSTTWRYTETDNSYDADTASATFGLLRRSYSHTVPADPTYDRCATTGYAAANTAANLVGLVAETETDSVACGGFTQGSPASVPAALNTLTAPTTVDRPAQVVSAMRTFYEDPTFSTAFPQSAAPSKGDATMVQSASTYTSGAFVYQTTKQTSYDSYGRVTATWDGNGNKTSRSYTTDAVGLIIGSTVTNPLGQATSTTVDAQRGVPLTTTDTNGVVTTQQYDPLGRITSVWLASRATTTPANYTYAYQVSNTGITAVTTRKLNDSSGYQTSTLIYDALLRERQAQTMTPQAGRMVTDTFYDTRGWVATKYSGWWDSSTTPNTTLVSAANLKAQVPNADVYTYNGLGRVVQDAKTKNGQIVSTTTTVYGGDRTTVTPPTGGVTKTTVVDPLGRTTELDEYTSAPTVAAPADTFSGVWSVTGGTTVASRYGYDGQGNQSTLTDGKNNTWTSTFNLLGRVTAKTDPDVGASSMNYDGNGNLTETTDARGKTVSYTYDALNRKTGKYAAPVSGQTAANRLASWVYDNTNNAVTGMKYPLGHLTTATAYWGGAAYTTQYSNFNVFGESLGEKVTIPSATESLALAGTYTYQHAYSTTTGLLLKDVYPAAGGLPAETVNHGYAGVLDLPDTLGGATGYAQGVTYDAYGRVNQETIGASPNLAYLTNTYDDHTSRLTRQLVTRAVATPTNVDDQTYSYDLAGNVTKQVSTRLGAASPTETQCYSYDGLARLTQAWTATDNCAATPTPTDHSTVGDSLGAASAYWTTWSFDALGNRKDQTQHNLTGGTDTTTSYTYNGNNTNQPHTLTATNSTGASTASTSYGYDVAGNMTARTTPSQGSQTLTWNEASKLTAVTGGTAGNSSFKYDPDGNLLAQNDPGKTILYLPGQQLSLDTASGTVTGTRYYALPGGGTVIRTGSGSNYRFALADQHGTPTVYLDSTAQTPTWRQYTPYGDTRGATTTWPDNHGFLDKPVDTATGLTVVGARNYDPTTGRFISPDPVLDSSNPQSWNGYAYANNSPVTTSDPSGLMYPTDGGSSGTSFMDYYINSLTGNGSSGACACPSGTVGDVLNQGVSAASGGAKSSSPSDATMRNWVRELRGKATLHGAAAVYDQNGKRVFYDDTFFSGFKLPDESGTRETHVEARVRRLLGMNGYLREGYTIVIVVDDDLPPCGSNCDTKLAKIARENGVRVIYRTPNGKDSVGNPTNRSYGAENSHADLEGGGLRPEEVFPTRPTLFDMLPKAAPEVPRPSGIGEVGGERAGPGGVGRAAGAVGEVLGPIGFIADIIHFAKYGPCGFPGMEASCQPHNPLLDA